MRKLFSDVDEASKRSSYDPQLIIKQEHGVEMDCAESKQSDRKSELEPRLTAANLIPVPSGPRARCGCGCAISVQKSECVSCSCVNDACRDLIRSACRDADRTCAASRQSNGQLFRFPGKKDVLCFDSKGWNSSVS